MAVDDLTRFVRDALGRGIARAQVEQALLQAGWKPDQVRSALDAFAPVDFPVPVPRPRTSLSAREAFQYLLLFATLYTVVFNLGSLLFRFIERVFPDPAVLNADAYVRDSIRFSVSALNVALPVFLYTSRLTNRAAISDPSHRLSPVRRWLTYLTLFAAACVLIGDVTSLLYSLLGGELTVRFVLKSLVVGGLAGGLFWYYLADLRRDERSIAA